MQSTVDVSLDETVHLQGLVPGGALSNRGACNEANSKLIMGELQLMHDGDTAVAAETFREAERYVIQIRLVERNRFLGMAA